VAPQSYWDKDTELLHMKDKKRVLVGLLEQISELVACEPVARYLKLGPQQTHLTWAVSSKYRELIDTNPFVDEVIALECLTDWIKLSRHSSYDQIVDLHVNYSVCPHCTIPLVKTTGNPFVTAYEWFDYGAILEAFCVGAGLPRLSAQPCLYLGREHREAVDALNLPQGYCVIHRTSSLAEKDWTSSGWGELSAYIQDVLKLAVVEVGAGETPSPLGSDTIDLVGRLGILEMAEAIRRARLFVGVECGPAQLANAVRTAGVVLSGELGIFRRYMPFTGFYASATPRVKIVRNLVGPTRDLTLEEVREAVRYVATVNAGENIAVETIIETGRRCIDLQPTAPGSQDVIASGFFDVGWYTAMYPDVLAGSLHPIDDFLLNGCENRRSPGPDFDTTWYLEKHPDIATSGMNPLLHYLRYGKFEGRARHAPHSHRDVSECASGAEAHSLWRAAKTLHAWPVQSGSDRLEQMDAATAVPRTFAFYLPQFHPIQENNWAHGAGYTEWHNVLKAKPQFRGHYQPKLPGELGFYDLRSPDILRQQWSLAREYGIDGFCFYYYYFKGKKLLFDPIRRFIESGLDLPFFFLWANENWTKRWDGGDREVIVTQEHSKEDDLFFIRDLISVFREERYVKIDGKPLLLIYKAHLFPDIKATTEIWRDEIKQHGFSDLYLVMVDDWSSTPDHPRKFGFDACYEIPSGIVPEQVTADNLEDLELPSDFAGRIVDYRKFAEFHLSRPFPHYKRFRTVMLPWDNTARYGANSMIHINGEGDAYKRWLLQALIDTYQRYPAEERIVFLHSWNEWCEGTYLEPDGRFGRRFLEQTLEAVTIARQAIALSERSGDSNTIAEILQLATAKEKGYFRVLQATRSQTEHIWDELERRRSEASRLANELARLRSQLAVAKNALQELEGHRTGMARLGAELDAIYRSNSWRLTGPLRSARRFSHKKK
jgi:hypothetical protein